MCCSRFLINDLSTNTDRHCYCERPYVSVFSNRISYWPTYSSPSLIFPSKVSPSSTCSCFSFLPPFAHHQSDYNLPQQTNFFPIFLHNSKLSLSRNSFSKCSIDPTVFNFTTKYEKLSLKPNIDKFGKHSQTLPLIIFCTSVHLF